MVPSDYLLLILYDIFLIIYNIIPLFITAVCCTLEMKRIFGSLCRVIFDVQNKGPL